MNIAYVDHRGFTLKDDATHDDCTIDKIVDDIEAMRAHLKLEQMILVGHSIHAFMAVEYARKYPDRVIKLLLIGCSPISGAKLHVEADKYFQNHASEERKLALSRNMQTFKPDNFIDRMLMFGPMLWYDYDFDARHLWKDVAINPIGAAVIWGPMFENHNLCELLDDVSCPVQIMLGRYDYFNPPYLWNDAVQKWKHRNISIEIFEYSGHTPQYEQANLFCQHLSLLND